MVVETPTVERMYGVVHGFRPDIMGLFSQDHFLLPSAELEIDLLSLPKGSTIGIEDFDPKEVRKETYKINGEPFLISKHSKAYWKRIKGVCGYCGLNIVYLDSFRIFKRAVAKVAEMGCGDGFEAFSESFDRVLASGDLTAEGYRAGIEAQYIFEVEREEEIIERLSELHPLRAIIGRGHGDVMVHMGKLLEGKGIRIGNYRREGYEVMYDLLSARNFTHLLPESTPERQIILERELLLRKYRAVREGRILANKTPDYIGTWDVKCPMRGLFEIFMNKRAEVEQFSGIIEDSLGTAHFEGEIDGQYASFLKTYDDSKSSSSAVKQPIYYEGELKNGKYEGEYSFRTIFDSEFRARFNLNLGSRLM